MENNKVRKDKLVSSEYRVSLGEELRKKKEYLCYTSTDISIIISLPVKTIYDIENGITKDIDYYVEYGKAVNYPLATLEDFNIPLTPLGQLEDSRMKQVLIDRILNNEVVTAEFLGNEKTIAEIRDFILLKKVVTVEELEKINLSNKMKALVEKELVEVRKEGNKNFYKIKG